MAVAVPLLFAAGGAWAGGAIGIGSAAGWALGSALGSVVEQHFFGSELPPNALTDLSVQTSSWGTGLPKIYGSQRVSGNIIWSTDKTLIGGSQGKYGGKGGGGGKSGGKKGGGSQGYYEVAIAFALCEGPISGIKRIWAGGNLIFDDSNPVYVPNMSGGSGGNQTFVAQNGTDTSSGGSALGNWIVYHGTGTQMPDPTISANGSALGPNGVPYSTVTIQGQSYSYGSPEFGKLGTATAYRGVAYIVFPNLNIGYGGTIPPLSFEVVGAGATVAMPNIYQTGPLPFVPTCAAFDDTTNSVAFATGNANLNVGFYGECVAYLNLHNFEIQNVSASLATATYTCINGYESFSPYAAIAYNGVATFDDQFSVQGTIGGGLLGPLYNAKTSIGFAGISSISSLSIAGGKPYPLFFTLPPQGTEIRSPSYTEVTTGLCSHAVVAARGCPYAPYSIFGGAYAYTNAIAPHFYNPQKATGTAYFAVASGSGLGFVQVFTPASISYFGGAVPSQNTLSGGIFFDDQFIYVAVANGSPIISVSFWRVVPQETADQNSQYTAGQTDLLFTTSDAQFMAYTSPLSTAGSNNVQCFSFVGGYLYATLNTGYPDNGVNNHLIVMNMSGKVVFRSMLSQLPNPRGYFFVFPANNGLVCLGNSSNGPIWDFWSYGGVSLETGAMTSNLLPAVLQSECLSAGLSTVDVSKVPSLSVNMTRKAGTAARDVLRTLCQIYMMDMVDSAGTLRFVPKGQPIAEVLDMKDIGHGKLTTGAPAAPYSFTRAQGSDLPRSLTLKYTSALAFFNPYAQRFDVASAAKTGKDVTVNVPMLTLDDKTALNIAMVLCASPHIEKTAYVWTMPLSFCYLEPGDVVQAPWGVTRITQVSLRDSQGEPVVELQGVIDATYVLNSGNGHAQAVATPQLGALTSTSSTPLPPMSAPIIGGNSGLSGAGTVNTGTPGKPAPVIGAAMANYIEVPPLTSSDTSPFFIAAAYTTGNTFPGAAFYESTDGGSTFADMAQQANSSFVGWALNALPNTQAWTWDTQSTLSVYPLSSGVTLASATDAQIFAGANLAAIGNELIQFSNATLTTDASGQPFYLLSRLLRGRKGTQWAMASHGGSETFVLISGNVTDIPYGLHDINQNALWKVATVTSDISSIAAQKFSPTGIWYKPWAVADAVSKVDSSNNWNLTFFPVARLNGVWGSGFAPGLDADTQTWSIDVLRNSVVVRTVNGPLITPSFQYTAAMQTADGFSPGQHGITLNIYQVGQLGRGYPATITT